MKIDGTYVLHTDRHRAWDMLNDPAVLQDCIPGAARLVETAPGSYEAEMNVGAGMIRGSFSGTVTVIDQKSPEFHRLQFGGKGPGGSIKGSGLLTLTEGEPGTTKVTVEGEVQTSGLLAFVGQSMLANASTTVMNQFFGCLDKKTTEAE